MADHLITDQLLAEYRCDVCGASISGGPNTTVGPLKCWRTDCPESKPPAPKLRLVKGDGN